MKITHLRLFTNKLTLEKTFYTKTLGFELLAETTNQFTIKVGWSTLTFERTKEPHIYHFCFLIPSNKLKEGLAWLNKRVAVLEDEHGEKIHWFESWNAKAFYFFDQSGNIVEFIVRYDLKNETDASFDVNQILCVNEIGMPTKTISENNRILETELNTKFWKGNETVFGTNGSQEGLFLLPNYELKDKWYPTNIKPQPTPFQATIKNEGKEYFVEFKEEQIKITSN